MLYSHVRFISGLGTPTRSSIFFAQFERVDWHNCIKKHGIGKIPSRLEFVFKDTIEYL